MTTPKDTFSAEQAEQQRDDAKFAPGRKRRLEQLRAARPEDAALTLREANEALAENPLLAVPPDPVEEANLRQAFGDRYASHPEARAHRARHNEVVADANLVVRRRPVEPEREGAPRYKRPGTRAELAWAGDLAYFDRQDAAWERQRRVGGLRCKALKAGKAGRVDGERCDRRIEDAQRSSRETCSRACKQRLTGERARLRKSSP